jgi:prepilin-type N-terminal cleavage/methylation domain-containing protein
MVPLKPKNKRPATLRGFSLLELLVVMAIFSVISLIVLANHSRFNSSVLLGSLAYDMALSVREAQVYGLSVRGQDVGSNSFTNFNVGYGIHFSGSSSYIFFADKNGNKKYDNSTTDSIIKTYTLNSQHSISEFCGITSTGGTQCSTGRGGTTITSLDVVFFRPDPDANMNSNQASNYSRAEIHVLSTGGETRTINIASTGQISVTNP